MVATWKTDLVDEIAKKIKASNVVGVVGVERIPSKQMQLIRKKIHTDVDLLVTRKNIIKRALDKAGLGEMQEFVSGSCGIITCEMNPFALEKMIEANKTRAPAKAGQVAPIDLVVPAGDTGLPAGPIIGDLQGAGIKARIQGGTILVSEDSVVVKAGEKVPMKAAPVLARLGIEPMDIKLSLFAAAEAGLVYTADVLHIDEQETIAKLSGAHLKAFNLSYNARIFNAQVMQHLICGAVSNSRNLMVNADIVNAETIGRFLAKADAAAKSLKSVLPKELLEATEKSEPKAEEPKVEGSVEENKAEEKAE